MRALLTRPESRRVWAAPLLVFLAGSLVGSLAALALRPSTQKAWIRLIEEGQDPGRFPDHWTGVPPEAIPRLLELVSDGRYLYQEPRTAIAMRWLRNVVDECRRSGRPLPSELAGGLLTMLRSETPAARCASLDILAHGPLDEKARGALLAGLRDPDWLVRRAAVSRIASLDGRPDLVARALSDPSTPVRLAAVRLLDTSWQARPQAWITPEETDRLLLTAARSDSSPVVRESAVWALAVTERNMPAIAEVARTDTDLYVREAAIDALYWVTDPRLLPQACEALCGLADTDVPALAALARKAADRLAGLVAEGSRAPRRKPLLYRYRLVHAEVLEGGCQEVRLR